MVDLPPLSTAAVEALVAAEAGRALGDGFAAACRDATAGNPFLLVELMRALDLGQVTGTGEMPTVWRSSPRRGLRERSSPGWHGLVS